MPVGFQTDPYDRRVLLVSDKNDGETFEPIHKEDNKPFEAEDPLIPAGFVGADGNWHPGHVDADGNLGVVVAGGGGGAVTIADGADVTQGAMANTPATTDTGTFSLVALFKRLLQKLTAQLPAALVGGRLAVDVATSTPFSSVITDIQDGAGDSIMAPTLNAARVSVINNGTPVEIDGGIVSVANSTTTPLGISAVFTGPWEEVIRYNSLSITVFTDQISGPTGVRIEQSDDAVTTFTANGYRIVGGQGIFMSVPVQAKYARTVYTNGPVAQASFRLQTIFHAIQGTQATPIFNGVVVVSGIVLPLKQAKINTTAAATTIITGVSNRRLRILSIVLCSTSNQRCTFLSLATPIVEEITIGPRQPFIADFAPSGYVFETSTGNSFVITQLDAPLGRLSGFVNYVEI